MKLMFNNNCVFIEYWWFFCIINDVYVYKIFVFFNIYWFVIFSKFFGFFVYVIYYVNKNIILYWFVIIIVSIFYKGWKVGFVCEFDN